jgi:tetratricopeptide (TPR) repeat protein
MDASQNPLVQWLNKAFNLAKIHKNLVISISCGVLIFGLIFVGYIYHKNNVEINAHRDFIQALEVFNASVKQISDKTPENITFATEKEKWESVSKQFYESYKDNKSSSIAPMFQAFQSEALINLGKLEEAISSLAKSIKDMPKGYLKEYYHVKYALMQLDSKDEKHNTEGLKTLEKFALNQKCLVHDQATYYLGLYFWITKKFDAAKNYWQQFLVKYGDSKHLESQIRFVRSNLDLVTV